MMVQFDQDQIVFPKESELFGQQSLQNDTIVPMEQTDFYTNDNLGLKFLNDNGKLFQKHIAASHANWSD